MPPKTKTRRAIPSTAQQSKLSFNNKSSKVTKSSATGSSLKDDKIASKLNSIAQDQVIDQISEPETAVAPVPTEPVQTTELPDRTEKTARPQDEDADEVTFNPKRKTRKARISAASTASAAKEEHGSLESTIAAAQKITDAKIRKYWQAEENSRIAPRVHQEGLAIHEKVLRHFDLSSQYGPCIGITRLDRWKRAHSLHMSPPVEVLAVLLKEEEKGNDRGDRKKGGEARQCGRLAYIDELAGGKAVLVE